MAATQPITRQSSLERRMATAAEAANPKHRSIRVVITPPDDDQPGGAARARSPAVAPPWVAAQRKLNRFVRTVAFLERAGNGLGMLAFTWATVVILGGFSTNLGPDFWYATAIVFLEAFRVFSRQSRSDDELLFKTIGSLRMKISKVPYYLNVGIVMVSLYGTIEFLLIHYRYLPRPPHRMPYNFVLLTALLALASMVQLPTIVKHIVDNTLLRSSPLVAVLAFGGVILWTSAPPRFEALVVAPLLVGCLQSLIATCLHKTKILTILYHLRIPVRRLQTLGTLIFPVWIAISVPVAFGPMGILVLLGSQLVGNIQIPTALARIGLSSMRLSDKESHKVHDGDNNEHLAPSLKIFYSMVLSQGTLYMFACISESLLFPFLRETLARALSDDNEGLKSVDLYYEHAYGKCMEDGILVPEDLDLVTFAVDSLNSNSRTKKLAAVQILHSLLMPQEGAYLKLSVSEIITSTKAVVTLISMLGWTAPEDKDIRFFAAKITAELAGDLLIVGIPGTIQVISSLLDSEAKNYLVNQSISAQRVDTNEQYTGSCELGHDSAARVDINTWEEAGYQTASVRPSSAHQTSNSKWRSKICKYFRSVMDELSVPKEGKQPRIDEDSFPVLGMLILNRLAHDLHNCAEISRATGLIPKIVGFITKGTASIREEQHNLIMTTSLKLVARLASVEGEIGIALRRKILEQPFLLSNVVEILECSNGRPEGAAIVIIAKLGVDEETRQKIGDFQVIIPNLAQTFLCQNESSNNTYCDKLVRMVAGEALSKLIKENTSYCSAILEETRYDVIEHLKNMLQEDDYAYVAASILWNLCGHSKHKLLHLGSLNIRLMSTLGVVLAKVIDTKGNKQLEALLVLASHLYNVNPERFAYEAESHTSARRLVQKLVGTLNFNQKSHPEYPRLRRTVVEVTISIVESCPRYSTIFREEGMMEALSKVEIALLMVEKYKAFLGNAGKVVESGLHLPDLLVKAKQLIGSTTLISAT